MAIKFTEILTRPNKDIDWKDPLTVDMWQHAAENSLLVSGPVGLIETGESISNDGCQLTEYWIYDSLESWVRSNAWHPSLTELRRQQLAYRDRMGITQTLSIIDTDTGAAISIDDLSAKRAEMRAAGFDPCVPQEQG